MRDKLGEIEGIYKDRKLKGRVNILGGRFRFEMDKNNKFMKIKESLTVFIFKLSRNIRRFMRIRRSMMRFRFEMSKNRSTRSCY
jgi:hypothetical protein